MTEGVLVHEGTSVADERQRLAREANTEGTTKVGYQLAAGLKSLRIKIGNNIAVEEIGGVITPVDLLTNSLSAITCGVPRVPLVTLVYKHEDKLIRVGRNPQDVKKDEEAHQRRQAEFDRKKAEEDLKARNLAIKQEQEATRLENRENREKAKLARQNSATKSAPKKNVAVNQPGIMSMFKGGSDGADAKERVKKPPAKKTAKKPSAKPAPSGRGLMTSFLKARPAQEEPKPAAKEKEKEKEKREESLEDEIKKREESSAPIKRPQLDEDDQSESHDEDMLSVDDDEAKYLRDLPPEVPTSIPPPEDLKTPDPDPEVKEQQTPSAESEEEKTEKAESPAAVTPKKRIRRKTSSSLASPSVSPKKGSKKTAKKPVAKRGKRQPPQATLTTGSIEAFTMRGAKEFKNRYEKKLITKETIDDRGGLQEEDVWVYIEKATQNQLTEAEYKAEEANEVARQFKEKKFIEDAKMAAEKAKEKALKQTTKRRRRDDESTEDSSSEMSDSDSDSTSSSGEEDSTSEEESDPPEKPKPKRKASPKKAAKKAAKKASKVPAKPSKQQPGIKSFFKNP